MPLVQWEVHMSNESSTKITLNPPEPPDGYSLIEGNLSNLEVEANKTNVYLFRANVQENTLTYYSPIKPLLDSIYPVGSIYTTTKKEFDPNVSFGGTWNVIANNRCLWGGNTSDEDVGDKLGETLPNIKGGFRFDVSDNLLNGSKYEGLVWGEWGAF